MNGQEIKVAKSKSTMLGWFSNVLYETGLMYAAHSLADGTSALEKIPGDGWKMNHIFHFADPTTFACAFAAEFVGEGLKRIMGINKMLNTQTLKSNTITGRIMEITSKTMLGEAIESAIFTSLMIAVAGTNPVTLGIIAGHVVTHYKAAFLKNTFRNVTEGHIRTIRSISGDQGPALV